MRQTYIQDTPSHKHTHTRIELSTTDRRTDKATLPSRSSKTHACQHVKLCGMDQVQEERRWWRDSVSKRSKSLPTHRGHNAQSQPFGKANGYSSTKKRNTLTLADKMITLASFQSAHTGPASQLTHCVFRWPWKASLQLPRVGQRSNCSGIVEPRRAFRRESH